MIVTHDTINGLKQPGINSPNACIARLMEHNPLQDDGRPFFCVQRGNLFNGCDTDLSILSIQAAIARIVENGYTARYLVVSPPRQFMAHVLMTADRINLDSMPVLTAPNPVKGMLDVVVNTWLTFATSANPGAWAVTASLDTDNASPEAWVTYSSL